MKDCNNCPAVEHLQIAVAKLQAERDRLIQLIKKPDEPLTRGPDHNDRVYTPGAMMSHSMLKDLK